MDLAPPLLDLGIKVIDLSGAFRLRTPEAYQRWYKAPHPTSRNCSRRPLTACRNSAGPHPRRALDLESRLLPDSGQSGHSSPDRGAGGRPRSGIVCDAKSGVSGAGRKASLTTSFCEVTDNFSAYSVLDHRHVPEVLNISGLEEAEFSFTAQLLPLDRGILETIDFRAERIHFLCRGHSGDLQKRYAGEPFVRLYAPGQLPDLRAVARTNYCDLGIKYDPERAAA